MGVRLPAAGDPIDVRLPAVGSASSPEERATPDGGAAAASARSASIAADLGLDDETSFDDGSVDFNDSVDDSFLFPENSNQKK